MPGRPLPGGLAFAPTSGPVPLNDWTAWWHWRPGARWSEPGGAGRGPRGTRAPPGGARRIRGCPRVRPRAGRELPTEAEFEFAARGGSEGTVYAWGDEPASGRTADGQHLAGPVPISTPWGERVGRHLAGGGRSRKNGYGLVDMIGNVWEWTSTYYVVGPDRFAAAGTDRGTLSRRRRVMPAAHLRPPSPGRGSARSSSPHARPRPARTSPGGHSRAARICVRRSTACVTGRPRGPPSRWTPQRPTSGFVASSVDRGARPPTAGPSAAPARPRRRRSARRRRRT